MIRDVLTVGRLQDLPPEEAAALLAARRSAGGAEQDEAALAAWLQLDPANARAWAAAQRAMAAFDAGVGDPVIEALRAQARAVARRGPIPWRPAAAAAAALIAVGLVVFGPLRTNTGPPAAPGRPAGAGASAAVRYAAGRGPPVRYALADGSSLVLDADSLVTVAYGPARRDVRLLGGRAAFEVVKDTGRPFVVTAGDRQVVATGTRFDVQLARSGVQVVLSQGHVSVSGPGPVVRLEPGQMLSAAPGAAAVVTQADLRKAEAWPNGLLTFDAETLGAAAAELNRYSRQQLVIRDPRVAQLRISGVFKAGDAERFAGTLSQVQPVRVVRRGPDTLELAPAS